LIELRKYEKLLENIISKYNRFNTNCVNRYKNYLF